MSACHYISDLRSFVSLVKLMEHVCYSVAVVNYKIKLKL